jgi:hypothetical protein
MLIFKYQADRDPMSQVFQQTELNYKSGNFGVDKMQDRKVKIIYDRNLENSEKEFLKNETEKILNQYYIPFIRTFSHEKEMFKKNPDSLLDISEVHAEFKYSLQPDIAPSTKENADS